MCGGGCCNPLGSCLGEITYTMEKLAACIAAVVTVSCIMFTIILMLGAGIGLGYNYCFVETRLNATLKAAKSQRSKKDVAGTPPRTTTTGIPDTEDVPSRIRRSKDLITTAPEISKLDRNDPMHSLEAPSTETGQVSTEDWGNQNLSNKEPEVDVRPTMMVPLKYSGLKSLIDKLQKMNRNFRIELLADRSIQG